MVHFIVSDPACKISEGASIYPYHKLKFTRCNPSMVEKIQFGLQKMTGNFVPIFAVSDWKEQANKLLTGK